MQHSSQRYSGHIFNFARINVILGANGAGKSKLLTEIRDAVPNFALGKRAVYIEGGRTIKIADVLQLNHTNVNQFDRYDVAFNHYSSKRTQSLADRVFDALIVLDKKDALLKSEHSDAVERWASSDRSKECPRRTQPPLEHLFELFSEIFPQITLTYNNAARQLIAHKGESEYGPSGLSDGEKQVFSILADLIELEADHAVIIADEPELNLHPELAERLWTLIENEFPEKTFIYATHSISFALRPNVDKIWVISPKHDQITDFTGLEVLPRADVVSFLGAIPGILSAEHVLVTEGHEKSFDAIFYRWILNEPKLEIYPAGSCTDVEAVVKKSGLWSNIATNIRIQGVIDSDYKSGRRITYTEGIGVHALPFHEAESYLCIPHIICAISDKVGSQEHALTVNEVENIIFGALSDDRMQVAARRLFSDAQATVGISLDRSTLAAITTSSELATKLRESCDAELARAANLLDHERATQRVDEELELIDKALAERDIPLALRLLPAKELLRRLAPRAGFKNSSDLMRSLSKNFHASDFEETARLQQALAP